MNSERRPWGPLAYLMAGAALGLVRLLAWTFIEEGPWYAGIFDAGHFLAAGALVAVLSELGALVSKHGRYAPWLGAAGLSLLLGLFFLQDDLGGFSSRQTQIPQALAYYGGVACVAAVIPLTVLLGGFMDRPGLRAGVLIASSILVILNGLALRSDYFGIHLFVGSAALLGTGASFQKAAGRPPWLTTKRALLGATIVALPFVVLSPPGSVAATLGNSTGAAFSTAFGRTVALFLPEGDKASAPKDAVRAQWFKSREGVPEIAAHMPPLLGRSPIVVLITIDALRYDVFASSEHQKLLPTLSRLRREGVVFEQVRATGTLTKNSVSGIFLGTHFSQQYWSPMKNRGGAITVHEDTTVRFTERLRASGVRTANFRSINWLRNGVVMQGFDVDKFVEYPQKKSYYTPSPPLFRALLPHLKKRLASADAAFIYSHLSDPHAPYDQGKVKSGPEFKRYLSEVALVDEQLGRLVDVLEESPRANEVLLIVSADHGEAFGEHKSKTHGTTMYDEVLRVPLVFWRPEGAHRTSDALVSLIDLGPTILDLFGQPTPAQAMGQSLEPFLRGESPRLSRPILAETRLMRVLVTEDRMKLIVDTRSLRRELYDLKSDPLELNNLASNEDLLQGPLAELETFFAVHTLKRDGYKPPFVK